MKFCQKKDKISFFLINLSKILKIMSHLFEKNYLKDDIMYQKLIWHEFRELKIIFY